LGIVAFVSSRSGDVGHSNAELPQRLNEFGKFGRKLIREHCCCVMVVVNLIKAANVFRDEILPCHDDGRITRAYGMQQPLPEKPRIVWILCYF